MALADQIRDAVCEYTGVKEGMEWTPDPSVPNVYAVHTNSGKEFLVAIVQDDVTIEDVQFTQWPPVAAPSGVGAWKMELR